MSGHVNTIWFDNLHKFDLLWCVQCALCQSSCIDVFCYIILYFTIFFCRFTVFGGLFSISDTISLKYTIPLNRMPAEKKIQTKRNESSINVHVHTLHHTRGCLFSVCTSPLLVWSHRHWQYTAQCKRIRLHYDGRVPRKASGNLKKSIYIKAKAKSTEWLMDWILLGNWSEHKPNE